MSVVKKPAIYGRAHTADGGFGPIPAGREVAYRESAQRLIEAARPRWRVTSDGGHLWLVMCAGAVESVFRSWRLAMQRANRRANGDGR